MDRSIMRACERAKQIVELAREIRPEAKGEDLVAAGIMAAAGFAGSAGVPPELLAAIRREVPAG